MRRYLTAFVNICWGFELLFSAGVVRASLELDSQWGWRSLSWFNGCGQYHCSSLRVLLLKVFGTLSKLAAKTTPERLLSDIEMEKAETQGASFLDCFKGSNTNLGHDGNGLSSTGPAKTSSTTPRSTCRPTE